MTLLADEQLCTHHLAAETGARQTSVSHHPRGPREAGRVDTEPWGRFTHDQLRPEGVEARAATLRELARSARRARDRRRPC